MLRAAGLTFVTLGTIMMIPLVLGPFGLFGTRPAVVAWILFPLFVGVGLLLVGLGGNRSGNGVATRAVGAVMLAAACGAALGLAGEALGVLAFVHTGLSLWYVLLIGLVLGALGLMRTPRA